MKHPIITGLIGMGLIVFGVLPISAPAADEPAEKSAIPPVTPELTGWNADKGAIKVLDETQKGPDGGRIIHIEGEASMTTALLGFVAKQETTYSISYSFRRLSPGNGWAGCIQAYGTEARQIIRPITYQKRYPDSSEAWTKVSETFKIPAHAENATLQIMTKPESLIEVADLKCTYVPAPVNYR